MIDSHHRLLVCFSIASAALLLWNVLLSRRTTAHYRPLSSKLNRPQLADNLRSETESDVIDQALGDMTFDDDRSSSIEAAASVGDVIAAAKPQRCQPHRNVVFLKTHKCASSSIQNVLMRYATQHNLTVVLPRHGNYMGYPQRFQASYAVPLPSAFGSEYNIFTHHTRWNGREIQSIMPNDTIFVTILREPASQFESLYNYIGLPKLLKVPLTEFLKHPERHPSPKGIYRTFLRNPMSFDLGLDIKDFDNWTRIREKIAEIDRSFALVMMADRFSESLLLLRRLLCWSIADVIALKRNAREKKERMSAVDRRRIYAWNNADNALYDYFKAKFERTLRQVDLSDDMDALRTTQEQTIRTCDLHMVPNSPKMTREFRPWKRYIPGFVPTGPGAHNETCRALARAELSFTDILRARQWPTRFRYKDLDVGYN